MKGRELGLILILGLVLFINRSNSQTVTFIDDTTNIFYGNFTENKDIDSTVTFLDGDKKYANWQVYFDHKKQHLAFESILKEDTCIMIQYWRNGKIKEKTIDVKGKENFFIWYSEEIYCENGQLIYKQCPMQTEEKVLIIRYYCNGQMKMKWWKYGNGAEGLFTKWYENGQKKSEWNFVNNKEDGEWLYWDEKGKLQKIEIYKEGKLIETK